MANFEWTVKSEQVQHSQAVDASSLCLLVCVCRVLLRNLSCAHSCVLCCRLGLTPRW